MNEQYLQQRRQEKDVPHGGRRLDGDDDSDSTEDILSCVVLEFS